MVGKEKRFQRDIPFATLSQSHQLPLAKVAELMAFSISPQNTPKSCQEKNDVILQKMLFAICAIYCYIICTSLSSFFFRENHEE